MPSIAQAVNSGDCSLLASKKVYSNAWFVKEAGDVNGFDLALGKTRGNAIEALLFVYEGSSSVAGIPLHGTSSGTEFNLTGDWIEDLVEYPSRKTIHQSRHVTLQGTLADRRVEGRLTIDGYMSNDAIRLKRGARVFSCKGTK